MAVSISFKTKLILSYIIVVLISFAAIAYFLDKKLEERSLQTIESSLVASGRLIEDQISAENLKKEDTGYLESLAKKLGAKAGCRVTIINIHGKVLADSGRSEEEVLRMDDHIGRPEVRAALASGIGIDTRYSPTLKIDMLYVALSVKDDGKTAGILRLALSLESVQKTLYAIRRIIFLGLLFAMGIAVMLGSVLAAQTLKPINRMIHVSRRFSKGDFSRRIIQAPRDEIGELANTLNKMAQDIEDNLKNIRTQNQQLAAMFDGMIEGVIVVDGAGRIISLNAAIERVFGISAIETKGKVFLEAVRNNDIAETIGEVLKGAKPLMREMSLVLPVRKVFQVNAVPVFDGGAVSGCLVVMHDITEIRKLETVRRDFIANVSHELKTPLTSIKGFVETLLGGALEDRENNRQFLEIIIEHTGRLDNLVNDLLSLSHLESKEITLEKEDIRLRDQLDSIIKGFGSQIKGKNIEVANDLPAGLSTRADKGRLDQVFTNLIDNAIKFNREKGTVRIYAQQEDGRIKVVFEDSGIGIPEKDAGRIFERFYRVDKARSRELGGTGLGLSIVKHIVEIHGGTVGVESVEGLGSKFWFTLPE